MVPLIIKVICYMGLQKPSIIGRWVKNDNSKNFIRPVIFFIT